MFVFFSDTATVETNWIDSKDWNIADEMCVRLFVCSQVIHLAIQAFFCLAMMHLLRPGIMEKAVFVWAMGYLCLGHIYRMYTDFGGYTLDITGWVKLPNGMRDLGVHKYIGCWCSFFGSCYDYDLT